MCCTISNGKYCNIAKVNHETWKRNIRKSSVATTQKSHCNIQKSSIATSKKPLQHGETMKNSKGMGSAPTLAHHLRAHRRKRAYQTSSHHCVPQIQRKRRRRRRTGAQIYGGRRRRRMMRGARIQRITHLPRRSRRCRPLSPVGSHGGRRWREGAAAATCASPASVLRRLRRTACITEVGEGEIERRQRPVWRGSNWVRKEYGDEWTSGESKWGEEMCVSVRMGNRDK